MRRIDIEQGSYEWHCERQGKVTGTTLKSALGSPKVQETLMYKMIAERMTEPQIDDLNSPSVTRGRDMEPLARKAISRLTGIEFIETGMLASEDIEGFALSPDAIYEEGGKVIGGLEIKCPDSKKHIEYLIGNQLPKEYADQVKAPFLMSEDVQWWYFASFDDRNYELPVFLLKITRDDFKAIDADQEKLKTFINRVNEKHAELTF
jgi:hypothetical protein